MLKLRPPIQLQTDKLFTTVSDSFSERVRGNYGMMGAKFTPEAFLHIAATPPSVYMAEGNVINLVEQNNVFENRGNWVSVFNNLVNRILISADAHLTYQDTVYISNILDQLGVKNVRTFMSEVQKLTRENKNIRELLHLYRENSEELREMVRDYKTEVVREGGQVPKAEETPALYLHESIFNRLQTAQIYNIVKQSATTYGAPLAISKEEYFLSEQTRLSQNLELQRFQNFIREENLPLSYRHENIYEGDRFMETDLTEQSVTNRISSAVLLNLIDNLYQRHSERAGDLSNKWLFNQNSFYGSADSTFRRIENRTDYIQYLQEQGDINQELAESYNTEISLVNELLTETSKKIRQGDNVSMARGGDILNQYAMYISHAGDVYMENPRTYITNESSLDQEYSRIEQRREENWYFPVTRNVSADNRRSETNVAGTVYGDSISDQTLFSENKNITNLLQQQIRNLQNDQRYEVQEGDRISSVDMYHRESSVTNEGDQIAQENIALRQELNNVLRQEQQFKSSQEFRNLSEKNNIFGGNTSRTEETSVNISNASSQTNQWGGSSSNTEFNYATQQTMEEEINNVQGDQFTLEQQLKQINQANIERSQNYFQELKKLEMEYQNAPTAGGKERILRESMAALNDPAGFVQQFKEQARSEEQRRQEFINRAGQLLGAKEGVANEVLRQYLENPDKYRELEFVTHNDIDQLTRDARFFEKRTVDHTETRKEIEERMKNVTTSATDWAKEHTTTSGKQREVRERIQNLELTHRQVGHTFDEELFEELREQQNTTQQTNREIRSVLENNEISNRQIINNRRNMRMETNNTEDISEIVRRSVRRQMDQISEKVYNRLERKLENEKRRRGL